MTAIVSFGMVTAEQKDEVEKLGLAIYSWSDFLLLVGHNYDFLVFISIPFDYSSLIFGSYLFVGSCDLMI